MTYQALVWKVAPDEPFEGGVSGGDAQVSDDVSIRFVPESEPNDGLHGLITETWWVEDLYRVQGRERADNEPEQYGVTCRIEYLVCTDVDDPGGTEVQFDYEYDDQADVRIYHTIEDAERALHSNVRDSLGSAHLYNWDGRTPPPR